MKKNFSYEFGIFIASKNISLILRCFSDLRTFEVYLAKFTIDYIDIMSQPNLIGLSEIDM